MARPLLQLTLLLAALPAQYLLSRWSGDGDSATDRLLSMWADLRRSYLNVSAWAEWMSSCLPDITRLRAPQVEEEAEEDIPGESPALEVLLHDNDLGYFGASTEVHSPRPAYVLHRVGQVVMETENHMIGVIISWDAKLRAPPQWIKKRYSESEMKRAEDSPHYKIVFNGPGPSSIMIGYLPQSAIRPLTGMKPDIPTLDHYFTHFDGEKFVLQPWLEQIYPEG
ncbi:uncharacterized protein LOC114784082 [Denticeps clupeoides]|uniref:Hemimethylated DNA-binding domain-containing protein n=1 Tax=Denticeps clupeoides TaxID=299321 RepID=A0AAY4C488_9TELE|nr:uncharacterized protein LOC114784082 [Denticeps clupeoides]